MFKKVTALTKEFPTFAALIRPFSSVDSPVPSKCVFAGEQFPTFDALVMPLSRVKASPKPGVLVGLHPNVGDLVLKKVRGGCEVPSTLTVCIGLLWHIESAGFHRVPALISSEGFLCSVVLTDVCTVPEVLPTGPARVCLQPGFSRLVFSQV